METSVRGIAERALGWVLRCKKPKCSMRPKRSMKPEQKQHVLFSHKLLLGLATLLVAATLVCAIIAYRYEFQLAPLWYGVIGIDVSNHQGDIDWSALAGSNVAFAYIKATEGGDFRDKRFQLNWEGAKKAGITRGAYHFFTQCRPGAEQAKNFIATVPREL